MSDLVENMAQAWDQRAMQTYTFLLRAEPAGIISAETSKNLADKFQAERKHMLFWQSQS